MNLSTVCAVLLIFGVVGKIDADITGWTEPAVGTEVTGATNEWNIAIPDVMEENSKAENTELFTAKATTGATSITYKLLSSTGNIGVIEASTGVVTVGPDETLDYEIAMKYVFVIEAKDDAEATGTGSVTLTLTDVNDVAPVFSQASYTSSVTACSTTGATVITVTATDGDVSEDFKIIKYTITGGNTNTEFSIASSSGDITVAKPLTVSSYTLTVQASDSDNEATATVTVTTSCITGWSSPGTASGADVDIEISYAIAENSLKEGDAIFTATATPPADESITYTLVSSTSTVGEIGANGVDVVVAPLKTLDFETSDEYEFVVLATASGGAKGTATVTVTITDVNETPAFSAASYSVCIADGSTAGTTLTVLTATDPDTTSSYKTLAYSISGLHNEDFTVDESSGEITVAEEKSIDGSKTSKYSLKVTATDGPKLDDSTNLIVNVMADCNSASVLGSATIAMLFAMLAYLFY